MKNFNLKAFVIVAAWFFATVFGIGMSLYLPNYLFLVCQIVLSCLAFPLVKRYFKEM